MARRMKDRIAARRRVPAAEGLESRSLMAVVVDYHPTPQAYFPGTPASIAIEPSGNILFSQEEVQISRLGQTFVAHYFEFNRTTGTTTPVPPPPAGPTPDSIAVGGIVATPDGNLWFTDPAAGKVGVYNPTTGAVAEYPLAKSSSQPEAIVLGPDGLLWFAENGGVGKIDPTTRAITEVPLDPSAKPGTFLVGPDGNLWFNDPGDSTIGTIDRTTGAVAEYPLPILDAIPPMTKSDEQPSPLINGPDGDLWFQEYEPTYQQYRLAKINPTSHVVTEYITGAVNGLVAGPDGKVWFTQTPSTLGEIDPSTGAVTSYTLAESSQEPQPGGIVVTSDGTLWVNDTNQLDEVHIIPPDQVAIRAAVFSDPTGGQNFTGGPLAGRTVYLDLNGNGVVDPGEPTAVTNAQGAATFTGIAPGTYTPRLLTFPGESVDDPTLSSRPITLAGGQYGEAPTFGVIETSSVLPMTYSANPFGTGNPNVSTAEVTGLYNILFNRAPDSTGLANAVAYLKGGGSLQTLASTLIHSTEYDRRVVAQDYLTFAGRAGSSSEIDAWVGLMQQGTSAEQVAYLMLTSAGFNAAHATDASFVQALYNDLLGRQASDAEVSAWTNVIASGTSRASVAQDFVFGAPAMSRAVGGFGLIFQGTSPDANALGYCVSYLVSGRLTLADVASAFASSSAFIAGANASVG